MWVGRISYSIYVIHLFLPWALHKHLRRLAVAVGFGPAATDVSIMLALSATSVAAAAFSWYLFEKRINNLKRHFPMRAPAPRSEPDAVPADARPAAAPG